MSMTRRQALASAGAAVVASSLPSRRSRRKIRSRSAICRPSPVPHRPPGSGSIVDIQLAVQEINAAGGIDGRQIELITRDTQSDPTKAVNGAAELTRGRR